MAENQGAAQTYPIARFSFKVSFSEIGAISFQEVTGLEQQTEFLEYRHGKAKSLITRKRAGMMKSSTVTFKRGIFKGDGTLTDFYNQLNNRAFYPHVSQGKNVTVQLLDDFGNTIMQWEILNVVPIKLSSPDLKSDANEVAIESLEVVHEGITLTVEGNE